MTAARPGGCRFARYADTVHCERCGGVWDAGDDPGQGLTLCPLQCGEGGPARPAPARGVPLALLEGVFAATLGLAYRVALAISDAALRLSSWAWVAAAWCDRRWRRASAWARQAWGR